MRVELVPLGRERTDRDVCRRYRPIRLTFDTRPAILAMEDSPDAEPAVTAQWQSTRSAIRMEVLADHGTSGGEDKIDNFTVMGSAPWSVVAEHNPLVAQIRSAFAHGDFYPALVGACALGERILNELLLKLRDDYLSHPATTKRVRNRESFDDWTSPIEVLHGWGVLTDELATKYTALKQQRHESVHYKPGIEVAERAPALAALQLLQEIVEGIFTPHGGPPRYIEGISGASFIALEAEREPLIRRFFLPGSALLSPAHRFGFEQGSGRMIAYDDAEYDPTPLSDAAFAAALPAGLTAMHPELQQETAHE